MYKKLNLCSGGDSRQGYLNVDFKNSDYDLDLNIHNLPFENGVFEEIIFKHALEHFRPEIGERLLKEIHRVLSPNGFLDIYVPDFELACKDFLAGENTYLNCCPAINRIYGLSTSEEQVHKWGYTKESLIILLSSVGFKSIEDIVCDNYDEIGLRCYKR